MIYLIRNMKKEKTYLVRTKDIKEFLEYDSRYHRIGNHEECVWKLLESGFAFEIDCNFWTNANGEGEESWAITPNEKVVKDQASSCTCEANTFLVSLDRESLENLGCEIMDFEDEAGLPPIELVRHHPQEGM